MEQVKKFQSLVKGSFLLLSLVLDLCGNMVKLGEVFASNVNESDPESTQRIASAYDQIMKSCNDEPLETAVRVLSVA